MKYSLYETYFIIFMVKLHLMNADDSLEFQKNLPIKIVWAVPGKNIDLPCDLSLHQPNDRVKMILWFKDNIGIPIYSVDSRDSKLHEALHWAISDDLGSRTNFLIDTFTSKGKLKIKNVRETDQGVFRCRVDFDESPTKNSRINLSLIESPSEPKIYDVHGNEILSEAGPYFEGHQLFLSCVVLGGQPRPKVTWWLNDSILDSVIDSDLDSNVLENKLFIAKIDRTLWRAKLQCRALSLDIATPITRDIQIIVYLKPKKLKIITGNDPYLSVRNQHVITCESFGSYPPAKIIWFLGSVLLDSALNTVIDDELKSISIIKLNVSEKDDGKELICRSENPRFSDSSLEQREKINVSYPPKNSIKMILKSEQEDVKEGENIQLSCDTDAKPAVDRYTWFYNDHLVEYDENVGTLPVDNLLYIQRITRKFSGNYTCTSANIEGESTSAVFNLRIIYAPTCKYEPIQIGAIANETVKVQCEVDAYPTVEKFSWTYNNSRDVRLVQGSKLVNNAYTSILYFTPLSNHFGTLACWASNAVGRQSIPCIFHLVPAKIPETPENCILRNNSKENYQYRIECQAGYDGGLLQSFVLEIIESFSHNTDFVENITLNDQAINNRDIISFKIESTEPIFNLNNLEFDRQYTFVIYSQNAKGRSQNSVQLLNFKNPNIISSKNDYRDMEKPSNDRNLIVLLGGFTIVATLIIVCTIFIAVIKICKRTTSSNIKDINAEIELNSVVRRRKQQRDYIDRTIRENSENGFDENFRRRSLEWQQKRSSHRDSIFYRNEQLLAASRQMVLGPDLILSPVIAECQQ